MWPNLLPIVLAAASVPLIVPLALSSSDAAATTVRTPAHRSAPLFFQRVPHDQVDINYSMNARGHHVHRFDKNSNAVLPAPRANRVFTNIPIEVDGVLIQVSRYSGAHRRQFPGPAGASDVLAVSPAANRLLLVVHRDNTLAYRLSTGSASVTARLPVCRECGIRFATWNDRGTKLAVSEENYKTSTYSLRVYSDRGRLLRTLVRTHLFLGFVTWSSTGTIAYVTDDAIKTLDRRTDTSHTLLRVNKRSSFDGLSYSPSGSRLAFGRQQLRPLNAPSVWVARADGTHAHKIKGNASNPTWS